MSMEKVIVGQFNNKPKSLEEIVSAYTSDLKIYKADNTQQCGIESVEKTKTTSINSQQVLLLNELKSSFEERSMNLRKLFTDVNNAISSGNNEELELALNSIAELSKSSPFKDIGILTKVRIVLNDPNYEW